MRDFKYLHAAGRVKRYHSEDIPAQSVGEHCYGVASLIGCIVEEPRAELLLAALWHDAAEKLTGDVPYPSKHALLGQVSIALANLEDRIDALFDLRQPLTNDEKIVLKVCDHLELMLYCLHQIRAGCEYAHGPYQTVLVPVYDNIKRLAKSHKEWSDKANTIFCAIMEEYAKCPSPTFQTSLQSHYKMLQS